MEEQSYAKHAKFVPLYHVVLFGIIVLTLLGSLFGLYRALNNGYGRLECRRRRMRC